MTNGSKCSDETLTEPAVVCHLTLQPQMGMQCPLPLVLGLFSLPMTSCSPIYVHCNSPNMALLTAADLNFMNYAKKDSKGHKDNL